MKKSDIKDIIEKHFRSIDLDLTTHKEGDRDSIISDLTAELHSDFENEIEEKIEEAKEEAVDDYKQEVSENDNKFLELLEDYLCGKNEDDFILERLGINRPSLADRYKIEWFKENYDKIDPNTNL